MELFVLKLAFNASFKEELALWRLLYNFFGFDRILEDTVVPLRKLRIWSAAFWSYVRFAQIYHYGSKSRLQNCRAGSQGVQ